MVEVVDLPSADHQSTLNELRREVGIPLALALVPMGLAFILFSLLFPDPLRGANLGILTMAVGVLAWQGFRRTHRAGSWLLVSGCLAVCLLGMRWYPSSNVASLLALPAGLAAFLAGPLGGGGVAIFSSLVLIAGPGPVLSMDHSGVPVTMLILIWGTVGLIWASSRPTWQAIEWSWNSYERARRLLEEARDQQVELKQTQADLIQVNQELARLSERLKAMYHVAEEARRMKEEFVANVSHELRTPLNMIIGFSEVITEAPQTYGDSLPPALMADITAIQRNSQHLAGLVDDVLGLSQVEAGRTVLSKGWLSLPDIVDMAAEAVRSLFDSKALSLELELAPDLPLIFGDATRIRQVVLNLLSNAGRFTEQGGVRVRAWCENNTVIVSVTDTGPGIAAEDQKRIFEPFQQVDGSIRRRHGGSGLGLSISKRFVEMHEGQMWLESRVGEGTTFYFRLPLPTISPAVPPVDGVARWLSPYHPYETRTRQSRAPVAQLVPRFVIMETGDTLQRILSRYSDRIEAVSVQNREQALRELNRSPARALVVNTPPTVSDSLSVEWLTGLPFGTPAITCWVPGEDEVAQQLGLVSYLVKPVSYETLLSVLEGLGESLETVLLVDDEPEVLQLFARMLASSGRGYRVLRASSGPRALGLLRERRPDVMLLDLTLPGMDGFEVLRQKSQDPTIQGIPVVVISARDPIGEPVVSNVLTVTRGGGLSVRALLACVEAISEVLPPAPRAGDPEQK